MSALIGPSNEEPLPRPPRQRGGKLRPPVDGGTTGGSLIRRSNVTAPRSRLAAGAGKMWWLGAYHAPLEIRHSTPTRASGVPGAGRLHGAGPVVSLTNCVVPSS